MKKERSKFKKESKSIISNLLSFSKHMKKVSENLKTEKAGQKEPVLHISKN